MNAPNSIWEGHFKCTSPHNPSDEIFISQIDRSSICVIKTKSVNSLENLNICAYVSQFTILSKFVKNQLYFKLSQKAIWRHITESRSKIEPFYKNEYYYKIKHIFSINNRWYDNYQLMDCILIYVFTNEYRIFCIE